MDLAYIISIVSGSLGIFLLAVTYLYIDKLEKTGCACAEHPYRNFIKKYCIFAIIFLAVTMFMPPATLTKFFGPAAGVVMMALKWIYGIATLVFFVMTMKYTRYLMREKCKCSEDMRREIIYIWSILEIVLMSLSIIIPIFLFVATGAFALAVTGAKKGLNSTDMIMDHAVNPIKGIKSIPKSVRNISNTFKKIGKK